MKTTFKKGEFTTFAQMLEALPTDKDCREYLEKMVWAGEPVCPHCGVKNKDHYKLKVRREFNGLYKCKDCRKRFTVTVGTMFEGAHIPMRKWFIAIYIFASHKKGVSSIQLGKDLGLTQKTAWFMEHRIRNAFTQKPTVRFTGTVQADETFMGGKNKNRHKDKKVENSQGRSVKDKTPVFGLVNNGKVTTSVIPDTKAETLKPIISALVEKGAIVVTDEWGSYSGLSKDFQHEVIKHNDNQFVRNGFHTNSIEGFWSLLKRGIYGIYHQTSPKHLHRYCDEFSHRFNTRALKDNDRFNLSLQNSGRRLKYKELISKDA